MDLRGFEPLTSSVRLRRAPSYATGPKTNCRVGNVERNFVAIRHPQLDIVQSGRRDLNPRPIPWQGIALPTEPLPRVLHIIAQPGCLSSADGQDRTDDPTIFSRVLYQLSYIGLSVHYILSAARRFVKGAFNNRGIFHKRCCQRRQIYRG